MVVVMRCRRQRVLHCLGFVDGGEVLSFWWLAIVCDVFEKGRRQIREQTKLSIQCKATQSFYIRHTKSNQVSPVPSINLRMYRYLYVYTQTPPENINPTHIHTFSFSMQS